MSQTKEILKDREIIDTLEKALEYEKQHPPYRICLSCRELAFDHPEDVPYNWNCAKCGEKNFYIGWEWHDVANDYHLARKLVKAGFAELVMKSNNHTHYRLAKPHQDIQDVITKSRESFQPKSGKSDITEENLERIFDDIVGYEDHKKLFKKAILKRTEEPLHTLLDGKPASAKTLFQLCIEKLPGAYFLTGANMSKAGTTTLLMENDIKFLLIDEIEKTEGENLDMLNTLMSTGRITETKHNKTREKQCDTMVIASSNRKDKLKPELLSKFLILHFDDYTESEFIEVATKLLFNRGKTEELAEKIAKAVWYRLGNVDIRDALKVEKLIDSEDDINWVLQTIKGNRK